MRFRSMSSLLLLSCLVIFSGCPKKAEVTTTPDSRKETAISRVQEEEEARKAAEAKKAAEEAAAAEAARRVEEEKARERAAKDAAGLKPVYFDFDKSFIREDAQEVLKANAEWMKAHPGVRIRIEGNCDELGTKEYNQALGQRRAVSARKFLMDMGIAGNRIAMISFGKEKPSCTESTEECRQRNRRDDFTAMGE